MKGENEHTNELVNMNFNFILDYFLNFISNINFWQIGLKLLSNEAKQSVVRILCGALRMFNC